MVEKSDLMDRVDKMDGMDEMDATCFLLPKGAVNFRLLFRSGTGSGLR